MAAGTCFKCTQPTNAKSVALTCAYCSNAYHIKCINVSKTQYDCVKSMDLMWLCTACKADKKGPHNATNNDSTTHHGCSSCSVIPSLIKSINLLTETVAKLEAKFSNFQSPDVTEKDELFDDLLAEFTARESKKKNVIIFNTPEQNGPREDREQLDAQFANKLLQCLAPERRSNPSSVQRIGKFDSSKKRPLKLTFDDEGDAHSMIRKAFKLKNLPQYNGVSISLDRTKMQVDHYKRLKNTMQERINNGEQLIIRYMGGSPKIVPKDHLN